MSDSPNASAAVIVRQLLATLEQSSLREEARALQQRFERQAWRGLSPLDIAQVAALVGQLPAPTVEATPPIAPPARVEPAPPPVAILEPEPEPEPEPLLPWSPLDNSAAWVDAVPRGRELLELLADLARCDDAEESAALLTRLFVEHLRYEAYAVDETARLDSETILRLRTIARHDTFVVSLAELSFPYTYPSTFQPIFRRHPYGLVVAIAPGWNCCQFAYRAAKDASSLVQRTRQLVGLLQGDEVQDSLVLWVRRMELLRPVGGDDGAALVRRAEEALAASPTDISRRWSPLALSAPSAPPGIAWRDFYRHERRAFLQEQTSPGARRVLWGLERALRVAFPFGLSQRRGRLCYRGYTLGAANSPETAWRMGGSWVRQLTLELELVLADGTVLPVSLLASIPEIDERGGCLIDGLWLRWVPQVLAEGLLVGSGDASLLERVGDEGETLELDEELVLPDSAAAPPPPEEQGVEPELEPTEQLLKELPSTPPANPATVRGNPLAFAGASLCTLLEMAAYRKLYSVRAKVAAYEGLAEALPAALGGLLRGSVGRDESLLLVSRVFLKAFLAPSRRRGTPEDLLPILRQSSAVHAGHAPAWACPEVSAALPVGHWLPVAGARVSPCGELAVPLREADADRLKVSSLPLPRVNPRGGGEGRGPASLWISSELSRFASLPVGRLQTAAAFAARGEPLDAGLRVLHVRGEVPRARMQRSVRGAPRPPRRRQLHVRIPMLLLKEEERPRHEWLLARGSPVRPGQVWLRADPEAWARDAERAAGGFFRHHEVVACSFIAEVLTRVDPPKRGKESSEEDEAGEGAEEIGEESVAPVAELVPMEPPRMLLPGRGERWFVPPGLSGTVLDLVEEVERDKTGMGMAWRLTLVVALEEPDVPWGHLLLPDGRSLPLRADLSPEEAPFGEDGVPVQLVIEDPALSATPLTEVWFEGASGELLETATSQVGPCLVCWEGAPVVGPDERLRFRLRDGEGLPAHPEAAALSAAQRRWWTAANPGTAAAVARVERAWSGGSPPFLRHLVEVMEAAALVPLEGVPHEGRGGPFQGLTMSRLHKWAAGYEAPQQDAPLRWRCQCGSKTGRARAFDRCAPAPEGCAAPVLPRPAGPSRRAPPVLPLSEPVLHPWHKETAAGLLGLTVPELERQSVKRGPLSLGHLLRGAVAREDPGAAMRERLRNTAEPPVREALLRCLRALERDLAAGTELPGSLWLGSLPLLSRALHPTGVPRGAPGGVKSPLTRAYLRVSAASLRLKKMLGSLGVVLLVETARRCLQADVDALFGPVSPVGEGGEPVDLSGLLARLWPLTRAPNLRSVVPGTFRLEGRPAGEGEPAAWEGSVERLPLVYELADQLPAPQEAPREDDASEGLPVISISPRAGVDRVPVRGVQASAGLTTTGVLTPEGPVFLPPMPLAPGGADAPDFWAERAARERLVSEHLPWLALVLGAFRIEDDEGAEPTPPDLRTRPGPSRQLLQQEGLDAWGSEPLGTLALRELMGALARADSRALEFCQLVEEGARAVDGLEPLVRRAFPGDGAACRMSRLLLVRALGGWWKGAPCEEAPLGWRWLPPSRTGPPGMRRRVPPRTSSAWEDWPGMAAVLAPARFLCESGGRPESAPWSHTLRSLLGFEAEQVSTPAVAEVPPVPVPLELAPAPAPLEAVVEPIVLEPEPEPELPAVPLDAVEVSFMNVSVMDWLKRGGS